MNKWYAVTGVEHGSYVFAKNKKEAKNMFQEAWKGEKVIIVKKSYHPYINS